MLGERCWTICKAALLQCAHCYLTQVGKNLGKVIPKKPRNYPRNLLCPTSHLKNVQKCWS